MNGNRWILACGALPLAFAAAPAQATLIVLDFEGTACSATDGGLTSKTCQDGDYVGSDYGSTTGLNVSYDPSEPNTTTRLSWGWTDDGGSNGMANTFPQGPADELAKVFFTPAAGYEVSFVSFQHFKTSATSSADFIFKVFDSLGAEIFSGGINDTHVVNTAYYSGPISFGFSSGGRGHPAVDNITVDLRQVAVVGPAVPEPASWAMMIGGFALVGGAIRSKRRRMGLTAA